MNSYVNVKDITWPLLLFIFIFFFSIKNIYGSDIIPGTDGDLNILDNELYYRKTKINLRKLDLLDKHDVNYFLHEEGAAEDVVYKYDSPDKAYRILHINLEYAYFYLLKAVDKYETPTEIIIIPGRNSGVGWKNSRIFNIYSREINYYFSVESPNKLLIKANVICYLQKLDILVIKDKYDLLLRKLINTNAGIERLKYAIIKENNEHPQACLADRNELNIEYIKYPLSHPPGEVFIRKYIPKILHDNKNVDSDNWG